MSVATHPPPDRLESYMLGLLDDGAAAEIEAHLAECEECTTRAVAVPPDSFTHLLRDSSLAASTPTFAVTEAWESQTVIRERPLPPADLAGHPRYRLVRSLGVGGMGSVWLAEHAVMGRPVALKVIRPEILAKPGARERFDREVRTAAKLSHPNIVAAHDAGHAGSTDFLVMEYVEGRTLGEMLEKGPLPVTEACRHVRDAARGLAHAHARGLVHRDVKPHNLMRTSDGTVKVLDFGLASLAGGESDLTGPNVVCGTPDYIAPEQAVDPRSAGARSDVYSLGCTLYHLLTGRVPFPGGSTVAKIDAHRTVSPSFDDIPKPLRSVVARMMAKQPGDRYQTADEVAEALNPFCEPGWEQAAERRRQAWFIAFLSLAALASVVVIVRDRNGKEVARIPVPPGGEAVLKTEEPEPPAAKDGKLELIRVFPYHSRTGQPPFSISRDNKRVAIAEGDGPGHTGAFHIHDIASGKLVRTVKPTGGGLTHGQFTPDGCQFIVGDIRPPHAPYGLRLIDLESGDERVIPLAGPEVHFPAFFGFSGDGKRVAFTESHPAGKTRSRVIELETGKELLRVESPTPREPALYTVLSPKGDEAHTFIAWRDDKGILRGRIRSEFLGTNIPPTIKELSSPAYTPITDRATGHVVARVVTANGEHGVVWYDPVLWRIVRETAIADVRKTVWAANGTARMAVWSPEQKKLHVHDLPSGRESLAAGPFEEFAQSILSPDGRLLAVCDGKEVRLYRLPPPNREP